MHNAVFSVVNSNEYIHTEHYNIVMPEVTVYKIIDLRF